MDLQSASRHAWFVPIACTVLVAQDDGAAAREWIGHAPFAIWTRILGDCAGGRTWLEEHGIEVAGGWTADWSAAWNGGLRNRATLGSLLDVNVGLDLERLAGIPHTLAFVDCYSIQGRDPSDDVGDIQSFSNIQAPDTDQVAEAWIETAPADWLRCKFGKIDFNSEFAFTEEGGEFINSSAAVSPTIVGYPTYPDPATALLVFVTPAEVWYVGAGVFDGAGADGIRTGRHGFKGPFEDEQSDALFSVLEVGHSWAGGDSWGSGRLAVGGWYHSARFTRFDSTTARGASGFYAVFDQRLWREDPTDAESTQGVGFTAQVAVTEDDVSAIALCVVAGVVWIGAIDDRDDDATGFLIAHAGLTDDPAAGFQGDETAFELFYKLQLTPAISLKPDLQFIVDPGGDPTVDDALVGTLRFEFTF
ncbi:MAG: carbohydrate porin [Planctomycetota bacterium]